MSCSPGIATTLSNPSGQDCVTRMEPKRCWRGAIAGQCAARGRDLGIALPYTEEVQVQIQYARYT
jgi:hypothetical protein